MISRGSRKSLYRAGQRAYRFQGYQWLASRNLSTVNKWKNPRFSKQEMKDLWRSESLSNFMIFAEKDLAKSICNFKHVKYVCITKQVSTQDFQQWWQYISKPWVSFSISNSSNYIQYYIQTLHYSTRTGNRKSFEL